MTQISPRLALPFLMPAQAQKHVTHNEALELLDIMVQTVIAAFDVNTPPEAPDSDQVFAIGPAPTGAWDGAAGHLAQWTGSGWMIVPPRPGWLAWGADGRGLVRWSGSAWDAVMNNLPSLGIGAAADDSNRLVVAAGSTLMTHDGNGHQVKVNKATPADTASLLFQTNWSGRAEIGLCGDDALTVKVSDDGSSFTEALRISSGGASGSAVQTDASDTAPGRLALAEHALMRANVVGPMGAGAVIETGQTADGDYVRFADGTQICTRTGWSPSAAGSVWTFPMAFTVQPAVTVTGEGASPVVPTCAAGSATSVTIHAHNLTGTGISAPVSAMAVGRWMT